MRNFILFGLLLIAACEPIKNARGNMVIGEEVDSFVIGKTTMEDVLEKCGTPSLHRDDLNWVYFSANSEVTSFKGCELKDQKIIKLKFGMDKILRDIQKITPKDVELLTDDDYTILITEGEVNKLVKPVSTHEK